MASEERRRRADVPACPRCQNWMALGGIKQALLSNPMSTSSNGDACKAVHGRFLMQCGRGMVALEISAL
jgi:hypothetical protein